MTSKPNLNPHSLLSETNQSTTIPTSRTDYASIGLKSRKVGLEAKPNIRRDDYNMEDLDDFFNENTVFNADQSYVTERRRKESMDTRGSRRRTMVGKVEFDGALLKSRGGSPEKIKKDFNVSPPHSGRDRDIRSGEGRGVQTTKTFLGSPLQTGGIIIPRQKDTLQQASQKQSQQEQQHNNDEHPQFYGNNDMDMDMDMDIDMDMDFDMNFDEDIDRVPMISPEKTREARMSPISLTQFRRPDSKERSSNPSSRQEKAGKQSLFVLESSESERFNEREGPLPLHSSRNITVRGGGGSSRSQRNTSNNSNRLTPKSPAPQFATSPLNSVRRRLESPLQVSGRSIAKMTKDIALGKKDRKAPSKVTDRRSKRTIPSTPPTKMNSDEEEEEEEEDKDAGRYSDSGSEFEHQEANEDDEDEEEPSVGDTVPDETIPSAQEEEEDDYDDKDLQDFGSDDDDDENTTRGRTMERSMMESDKESPQQEESTVTSPPPPSSKSKSKLARKRPAPQPISRSISRAREHALEQHHIPLTRLAKLQRQQSDLDQQQASSSSKKSKTTTSSPSSEVQPVRRSSRVRMAPLAYWRNERVIYEKKSGSLLPTVKEVITVEEPEAQRPLAEVVKESIKRSAKSTSRLNSRAGSRSRGDSMTRRRTTTTTTTSRGGRAAKIKESSAIAEEEEEEEEEEESKSDLQRQLTNGLIPGSEWIHEGYLNLPTFIAHGSDQKSPRVIAWSSASDKHAKLIKTSTDNFKLSILFDGNKEFTASGIMHLPVRGKKSMKSTDSTYFVFYVIEGVIEVTLSGNVFMIGEGCSVEVPMGNFYQFVNKGEKTARLFFVQTRGVAEYGEDTVQGDDEEL